MGVRDPLRRHADVELHIDEIVLTGTGVIDRDRLHRTIAAELTRLLQAHPMDAGRLQGRSASRLHLGSLRLSRPVHAESLGKQIAGRLQQFLAAPGGHSSRSTAGSRGVKR